MSTIFTISMAPFPSLSTGCLFLPEGAMVRHFPPALLTYRLCNMLLSNMLCCSDWVSRVTSIRTQPCFASGYIRVSRYGVIELSCSCALVTYSGLMDAPLTMDLLQPLCTIKPPLSHSSASAVLPFFPISLFKTPQWNICVCFSTNAHQWDHESSSTNLFIILYEVFLFV